MLKLFDRNSTKLTISEFYDNFLQKKYKFDVEYQRKSNVWNVDKKSFLIDSIMKNYPMPPIFMRPNVDTETGKTKYDIVDGKQRLEAIISFIDGKIPLTSYFSEDDIFLNGAGDIERDVSGKFFGEIKADKRFNEFVKQFWTYSVNIDYLYEDDTNLISNIFDRLNRNGEPLTRQELRNAKYSKAYLLITIKELTHNEYWINRFKRLRAERMEDEEFISELFFLTAEDKIFESSPLELDALYDKYSTKEQNDIQKVCKKFDAIVNFLKELNIDYEKLKKLNWTTHLYGLYSVGWYCVKEQIPANSIRDKLIELYEEYFNRKSNEYSGKLLDYKDSCSSRTRSKTQRVRRLRALLEYCDVELKDSTI